MSKTKQAKTRAQRAKDFANQNIESAKDFDFDQHNKEGVEGTHVSGQEIKHLRSTHKKNGGTGNFRDTYAALQAQKDSGATFGKNAQRQFDRMGGRMERLDARKAAKEKAKAAQGSTGQETNPIDESVTGEADSVADNHTVHAAVMPNANAPVQNNDTDIENSQEQEVNQDNDINTNVSGSNNTVITEQDNSIRQYGGDNRSFVYNSQGGSGGMYDSPVSAATMGGFYDVDDSPAAQAKFNDMYTTMNADNQKRYAGDAMKTFAKYGNLDARSYTDESMENALGKSTQYSFDRADRQTGHVFGDIWNEDYITEDWKMPTPPKAVESNAEEIADKAKEDIDDV